LEAKYKQGSLRALLFSSLSEREKRREEKRRRRMSDITELDI